MDINYSYFNTAKGYKVIGGTAAQFLKADGSVDSNAYLPLSGGTMTGAINFSQGSVLQYNGSNRIRFGSTHTIISTDGTSDIYFRPKGDTTSTSSMVLSNNGNLSLASGMYSGAGLSITQSNAGLGPYVGIELIGQTTERLYAGAVASTVGGYIGQAKYMTSNLYQSNTTYASLMKFGNNGDILFYGNTGLTANTNYAPTELAKIDSNGVVSNYFRSYADLNLQRGNVSRFRAMATNTFISGQGTAGTIYFRPQGDAISTNELTVDSNGTLNLTSAIAKSAGSSRIFNKVFQNYTNSAINTGILTFKVPQASTAATMFDVTLKIYSYSVGYLGTIRVSFYKITGTTLNASGRKALIECSDNFPSKIVNVGLDASGNVCINIGDESTIWGTYLTTEVERVSTMHSGAGADWSQGWSQLMENTATVATYQATLNIPVDTLATQSWLTSTGLNNALKVSGNGVPVSNGFGLDTFLVRNASVWAGSTNRPGGQNSAVVNFTPYNSAGSTYGFSLGARSNKIYFVTEENSAMGNWLEIYHSGNLPVTNLSNYYTKNEALNQFVGLNGVQTIADTKTFSSSPVVPNATLNSHAINYGQFNNVLDTTLNNFVPKGQLGVPNGVASLGANGIVPANQLPSSFERTLLEFTGNFGEKLVQAINAANNGDTINALNTPFDTADSYTITSSININKPINIKFPAGTINFLGSGNIFNINASNVRFYGTGRSSREDLRIITTNITYPNGNGGYHFYARGQNVITVSNMDITGVRTTNYDAQQGSATKPIDGSGGIYIEKPNPGTTGGGNTISNIILENLLIHGTRAHGIYLDTPILGSIKDVRISQGGGHGIFINGGTSMRIENCYVSSTHKTAYALYAHSYSVMNACAAEFSGNGYWLRGCFNVTLLSCGAESNGNRGATVPNTNITTLAGDGTTVVTISDVGSDNVGLFRGTSYVITGGQGINLINCASTNAGRPSASNGTTVSSRDILVRGNTRNVFIGSPRTSVTSGNIFPGRFNISFEGFNGEFPKGQVVYNPATDGSVAPAVANQYISSINNDANAAPVLIQPGSDVLVMSDTKIHTPITTNQITSAEGLVGNASTASKLQTARVISLTGDATGTINFDGSENISINTALSATGISSGTYKSITVDNKGRVTAGSNPTTLSGFGIADGMSTNHVANGITSAQISNWIDAYLFSNNFAVNNPDLTAIEALSATDGYLRKDGNGQWSLTQATYTLPVASSSVFGGVKLINDTIQTAALDSPSSTAKRTYGVQMNPSKQMVVNVPWVNTTYSNGTGINLVGTQFSANFGTAAGTIAQGNDPRIVNAIKLNTQFTINTGSGLVLSDDYMGGESGIYDETNNMLLVGKENGFHKFGASYGGSGGVIVNPQSRHMGYGGVDPTDSHNHYFNGTIRITQGIYSESSNGDNVYAGNGGFYHLDQEIVQEDNVIRLAPFDKVFSGTNNTFATKNRVVKITLNDGGAIMMDEFFINQEITIMNISGDYATFIVNNTSIKVKIDPRSSATFYVNSENKMVMVRMDNDYCRILG